MKVVILSFFCIGTFMAILAVSPFYSWLHYLGVMPVNEVSAQQVNDMQFRPMSHSLLYGEIQKKHEESCQSAFLRHKQMAGPQVNAEHCPGLSL